MKSLEMESDLNMATWAVYLTSSSDEFAFDQGNSGEAGQKSYILERKTRKQELPLPRAL
jgi:hypothetical protein